MRMLSNINRATQKTGVVAASSDPLLNSYSWLSPAKQIEHQPAIRIDYNLGDNHRLTGTFNKLWQDRNPDQLNDFDQRFPGRAQFRPHRRAAAAAVVRAALDAELRARQRVPGRHHARRADLLRPARTSGGPQTFEDTGGYAIDLDANIGLTNWHTRNTLSGRSAYQYTFDETLTWQKGKHSVTFGGGAFLGRAWDDSQQLVPGINLGFNTANDPAAGLFSTANFPGASAGQLDRRARALRAAHRPRRLASPARRRSIAETNKYYVPRQAAPRTASWTTTRRSSRTRGG